MFILLIPISLSNIDLAADTVAANRGLNGYIKLIVYKKNVVHTVHFNKVDIYIELL